MTQRNHHVLGKKKNIGRLERAVENTSRWGGVFTLVDAPSPALRTEQFGVTMAAWLQDRRRGVSAITTRN